MKFRFSIYLSIFISGIHISITTQAQTQPGNKNTYIPKKRADSLIIPRAELEFTTGAVPTIKAGMLLPGTPSSLTNIAPDSKPVQKKSNTVSGSGQSSVNSLITPGAIDAGRTAGSLDVSSTGAATYSVALTLPPGIGNVLPQISLMYNSQGGNGNVGLGWNISGLSVISRVPATNFHDGFISAINYGAEDRFALDGQRLMLKSGVYGGDGAEYQTENYSNIRVFSRGGSGNNPNHFEVLFPDGSKAFYGMSGIGSKTPTTYAIDYSENPLGARITYFYTTYNNSLVVTQIVYGGMDSSVGMNQILFSYTASTRAEQAYVGGEGFYSSTLLDKISIVANGTSFRQYQLAYGTVSNLNYQRLTSIQELNGDGTRGLEPINFTYGATGGIIPPNTISNFGISGIDANNSEIVTADFTGNGTTDFLWYNKADKSKFYTFYDMEPNTTNLQLGFPVNSGFFTELIPASFLTSDNSVSPQQGIIVVKENGPGAYKFEMVVAGTTNPVYFQYDRVWDSVPYSPTFYAACDGITYNGTPLAIEFLSGDFNGDGLTDIIGINNAYCLLNKYYGADPVTGDNFCDYLFGTVTSSAYFINMDRRLTSNYVSNTGALLSPYLTGDRLYAGDFNGDGKTDIFHEGVGGVMYVYTLNSSGALELLWQTSGGPLYSADVALIGDYNGDGKTDLMFSNGYSNLFTTYLSTGKAFVKYDQYQPFSNTAPYWSTPAGAGSEVLRQYYLIPNDVDGDGKTDIIRAETVTQNSVNGGTINLNIHQNTGPGTFTYAPGFAAAYTMSSFTNLKHNPIPVFLNPNRKNFKPEFGFLSDATISLFRFSKDFKNEMQISSIQQGPITYNITYDELTGQQTTGDLQLYQPGFTQTYPYTDLQMLPGVTVVSKMTRSYNGEQLSQVFGYGKAVAHLGGLGFQGFGELIRSNWHQNSSDNNRIFNITLHNPQLRGAMVRSFSAKSSYINPAIKGLALTSPVPATGIADGASINDYINRSDQVYSTQLLPNNVFVNVVAGATTKDMLTGTFGTQAMEYDAYNNVTKSVYNFNGTGSKTLNITYDNNPAANYIGRPLTNSTTLSNGADTYSTEEEFTYIGSLPSQVKKRGNNTGWITENMSYDGFGNVTQKTITEPGGAQRTVLSAYDATGRFKQSITDVEGMVTSSTYDSSTGNVITTTNPYGNTTTTTYDSWNRVISVTNHLGKKKTIYYSPSFLGAISVDEVYDDGRSNAIHYNVFGQKRGSRQSTVLGDDIADAVEFDIYGRIYRQSEPAPPGSASQWNYFTYDEYGRSKQTTSFTGKVTNFSYNGLSVTINDGTKSITTTKNVTGQVQSLQDPGGTINYTYYANGNLKTTDYGGIVQSIEQDGWGRKTKLTDPSSGVYEYQYDGWGQMVKEITPKGVSDFIYSTEGKLTQKKMSGDDTNMQYDYSYDATTKLLNNMSFSNADGNNATYTHIYDTEKRLSSTIEDNLHARFAKSYTYDSFGRVATESFEAKNKANNIIALKTIEFQYQNGELLQTTLQGTGQVLWKIGALDGKGNLTQSIQGAALKNTYQYDTYNLPQQSILENVSSTPVTLMNLGYSFDGQRGLLNSRSNSAFNWSESFGYDNQDRLTSFNDNQGNNSQDYDNRGRITDNSQLGTYSYNGGNYQQTELDLSNNSVANSYYEQQHALQQVSYNAFKSPVEIYEQGKERVSFQYGASLGRSHMYYGDEQADKMLRRYRKHYSEDGEMEISNDMQTGKTSFVFYLGGDAYSAPAIWKEVHENGQHAQNLYYLHRDHLGSIVMITDDQGGVVEKRQFDAWGNIVKLQNGFGNDLAAFVILDRGFTGHEHLLGVGLIHMNGRLYDPKLHRFLSPDNFVQDPYNTQNYNRYGYAMNNPLMFTDPSGEFLWAFVAIGALVGALTGGISYTAQAIRTGDWSWKGLLMSTLSGAVIGGITGGANPYAALSSFASWPLTGIGALVNGFMPTIPIISSENFNLGISPLLGFGSSGITAGANINASGNIGDFVYTASAGMGVNSGLSLLGEDGGSSRYWNAGGFLGYNDGKYNYGAGYSYNTFGGKTAQGIAAITLQVGQAGLRVDEDYLGDGGDRFRTGGAMVTFRINTNYTLATGLSMITGQTNDLDVLEGGNPKLPKGGRYDPDKETMPTLREGTWYGGLIHNGQATFIGHNSETRLHSVQNYLHRRDIFLTPYFPDRGLKSKLFGYLGGYNSNYLFY